MGWNSGSPEPSSIPKESIALSAALAKDLASSDVPGYVLTYAPLVILEKSDTFYPSDMETHVSNTHGTLNFTPIAGAPDRLSLENIHLLNNIADENATQVYLTSNDELIKFPKWLHGEKPDSKTLQTKDAKSCVVIVVDKGKGIMDAFYMYFYTFNQGPTVVRTSPTKIPK